MDFHKLLQKQIKKHLTEDCADNPSFKSFIKAVNDSYIAFERDKDLMNHLFEVSEKEYHEINDHLKNENLLKQQSISNLYDSLDALDDNYPEINPDDNVDDLLFISKYLNRQIEKRREIEKTLSTNVELLKTLLANLQSGIMVEDSNRQILFSNQLFCDMRKIRVSPEKMVGINNFELIEESKLLFNDPENFISRVDEILNSRQIVTGELLETNENTFFERNYAPIFINNELKAHLWKYTDVTQRIKDQKLLEQSEKRNTLIMNSALNAIIIVTDKGEITFWNQASEQIFGWKENEVLGENFMDLIIPSKYKDKWIYLLDQYFKNDDEEFFFINKNLEFSLINKAGNGFLAEASFTPLTINNETFFCAFLEDISKRKEAENQLLNTAELLKALLANLQSGVLVEDENRKILFTNQLFCDIFSIPVSPENMVGIDCTDSAEQSKELFKDSENFGSRIEAVLNKKEIVTDELFETIDNHFFTRDYIPIFIDKVYKGHLWKYTNVSHRIKNQKLLEQSEQLTRTIMNSALNAITIVDSKGAITFLNNQAESLFGWKEKEITGKIFTDYMVPVRNKDLWNNAIIQYLVEGHNDFLNKQVELFGLTKNGNEFLAEISITPILQNGKTFFCAFFQDISKRKEIENQLSQTAELLKTILVNRRTGVLVEDENQKILYSNQLYWDIRNPEILAEDMEGVDFSKYLIDNKLFFKNPERYVMRVEELLSKKKPVIKERIETADNRYLERDFIPIYINDEYKGHLWEFTDVTQKIQSQNLLRQSESLSRLIMNASMDCIITIDIEGLITFWNRRSETLFGWKKREVLGKILSDLIIPKRHNSGNIDYLNTGEGPVLNKTFETMALNKEGDVFAIEISIIPITRNGETFFVSFIHDISNRKKAERIRKIQEEKYQNIIANMNLGLIEVDNNEIIQYANQSFSTISGYEVSELIGKNAANYFVLGKNLDSAKNKNEIRKQGVSDIYQLQVKNKNGELKWWAISGAPNYDDKGNVIGSIGIHLDITDQKQLEIDLEKEKFNAIESSKAKEIFLANMSHEIRTPLNAIIGFLRELNKLELTELQKKYIDNSTIASKHLLAIINNILDLSKIEAGEMSLEEENFVIKDSISNVSTILLPMLEQKGLYLNVSLSEKTKKVLIGDALRLQQILFNLIGNAIKFTSKGSISINCEVVNENQNSQELKISVTDTGVGMESSFVDNIFNKFSQEDKSITRKYGGTGLGLSITKELVKLMNGRIEIESEKHKGTTFHIYIQFNIGDQDHFEDQNSVKEISRIDNISILLVEDNYLNRMIAQNSLQYYDCQVTEAENGLEAIEILKNNQFDIILMDIQMPEMGGIEATEIIRKELNLSTPIIALTANAFKTEIDKCRTAGMDDFVSKPFDEDVLIEMIAKYTVNKSHHKSVSQKIASTSNENLYDLSILLNLSRGDIEFVLKMAKAFVEQTTETIEKVENAIRVNDFTEVGNLIHKIRPNIENLGITTIIDDVKLLEKIAIKSPNKEKIISLFGSIKVILEKVVIHLKENELNI